MEAEKNNLDLEYKGSFNFGYGIKLPIKIQLREIDEFIEPSEGGSNSPFNYIYKIRKYKKENYKFFEFVDIDILNDRFFDLELENEVKFRDSVENVDYEIVDDFLLFKTGKAVYEFVLSQNPYIRDELILEYKHFILSKMNSLVSEFISLVKVGMGIGRMRVEDTGWLYHEFYTAYGKGSNGAYFRENSPAMSFQNKSMREQIAVKFYRSRENEIQEIIHREAEAKGKRSR